jgi:hypothetical protein
MKFKPFLFFITAVGVFAVATDGQTGVKKNQKQLLEITVFRQQLVTAIDKRDRKTLETFFAEAFTHTHAIGRVDGKARRIDAILTGDRTLESVTPDEFTVRLHGSGTAIAVGQTNIEGVVYRWTVVYVKYKKNWQIAASQAGKVE